MGSGEDSFSKYVDTLRAFHTRRFAAARESIEQEKLTVPPPPSPPLETPTTSPPPRETNLSDDKNQSLINSLRSASLTPQETDTCLQSLTNVMTSSEDDDDGLFQEVISEFNGSELQRIASLLTSNNDHYFLEIARNKNGSIRLKNLLGISDDADVFFLASILRHFLHVMTDKNAAYVATQGMRVFSHDKKMAMRDQILNHAIHLARERYGCGALNAIIGSVAFAYCNDLHDVIALNAPLLSYDAHGNYVVQYVLKQNILRRTYKIAVSLRGHYVELSFTYNGRYVVEKLLEREETRVLVVTGLLEECGSDKLVRLATSRYGNFVVEKALKLTRGYLFWGLMNKLRPFLHLLRGSNDGTTIAEILESVR